MFKPLCFSLITRNKNIKLMPLISKMNLNELSSLKLINYEVTNKTLQDTSDE